MKVIASQLGTCLSVALEHVLEGIIQQTSVTRLSDCLSISKATHNVCWVVLPTCVDKGVSSGLQSEFPR